MTRPEIAGRALLVLGLGRSGCAAGALLRRHGARVIGVDDAEGETVARRWQADALVALADRAFDEVIAGRDWPLRLATEPDAVVLSPGVPPDHPALARWRVADVPIHGELEWATRYLPGRSIGITGTNGKSTTTAWLAHVLRAGGLDSAAVGNLGTPLAAVVDELDPSAVPVVECSSFQLETIDTWRPDVGVVLNLAPDHLDRYPDLAAYHAAKARLAAHVAEDGHYVTWTGCPEARRWRHGGRLALFGDEDPGSVAWIAGDRLRVRRGGESVDLVDLADLALDSPPNLLNAAAVAAAALPLVKDLEAIAAGLQTFHGLPHRHQLVGRLGGVRFVNDTKATNVHAVEVGLAGYPRPVVLIAGGRGKGEDYTPLRQVMSSVRHVVTIGEEGPAIAAALAGVVPTSAADDLATAVAEAAALARPDATVLLSPACASFDMYANYRERGEAFVAAVRALGAGEE
ncbi:UDP-N-acetylmuramoyl-L-alanine--D-glutamate ligase [bacterium]|nr:UDP-N-acetylmuramoyl-L-alanine--D-glutamate ligase [bacterium]